MRGQGDTTGVVGSTHLLAYLPLGAAPPVQPRGFFDIRGGRRIHPPGDSGWWQGGFGPLASQGCRPAGLEYIP